MRQDRTVMHKAIRLEGTTFRCFGPNDAYVPCFGPDGAAFPSWSAQADHDGAGYAGGGLTL